ncbi:MAG: type I restriction enzyme S subunit, partial [Bacteroidia bacterium]
NIGADKYAFLEVPLPPKSEQSKIANYLDKKTAEIDDLIAQKKKLLQLYKKEKEVIINQAVTKGINPDVKLKKSGVEYIGQIPEQWDIKKLRYLGKCANGISKSGDQFGFGFPFISYGDVYKNRILPKSVDGLVNSSETDKIAYSVIKGDVLFTRTSETIEEIGLASTCIHSVEDAVFAGFLIRFRPFKDILFDGFSNYYFSAQIHRRFFVKEMNLVTRASLSQELLKRLPVALPSIEEQKEIAEFLDKYISEIESKSTKTKKLIALLTEYKTALISEVVTGKIKIN